MFPIKLFLQTCQQLALKMRGISKIDAEGRSKPCGGKKRSCDLFLFILFSIYLTLAVKKIYN